MNGGMSLSSSSRPQSAPAPLGPGSLWPEKAKKSQPRACTSTGRCGADCAPSTTTTASRACAQSQISRTGLSVPSVFDWCTIATSAHAALALDRRQLVEIEPAVVGHADVAQRGARPAGQQLPRHHVRVVLHLAAHDHVARPAVRAAVGVGDEVEGLRGIAHEDALATIARIHEAGDRVARGLVGVGRLGGDRVHPAMHVGVVVLVDVVHRVQHLARGLRGGRRIQVRERVAVDLPRQDREVGAQLEDVEGPAYGSDFHHRSVRLVRRA